MPICSMCFDAGKIVNKTCPMCNEINPVICKTCGLKKRNSIVKVFTVIRQADESGHSGLGHVISGVVFEDGQVAIRWNTPTASTAIYRNFEEFKQLHIDQHPSNRSIINMIELNTSEGAIEVK